MLQFPEKCTKPFTANLATIRGCHAHKARVNADT